MAKLIWVFYNSVICVLSNNIFHYPFSIYTRTVQAKICVTYGQNFVCCLSVRNMHFFKMCSISWDGWFPLARHLSCMKKQIYHILRGYPKFCGVKSILNWQKIGQTTHIRPTFFSIFKVRPNFGFLKLNIIITTYDEAKNIWAKKWNYQISTSFEQNWRKPPIRVGALTIIPHTCSH